MLRRVFGPKSDEVTEEWRRLHNEELNVRYSSSNIIREIKSRRMSMSRHVAVWTSGEVCIGFWWGNWRERDNLEARVVGGRIIFRWIFMKWDGGHGLDRSGSG
jgi:hypothetical protein